MDKYEFPPRQFTLGQEPMPIKSIGYFSNDTKLFSALGEALNRDEWEELGNSRLGVFIKFHKLEFGWASRLVHYMLTYQLDCKKKYELWSLIGVLKNLDQPLVEVTDEMRAFWGQMGVNLERGPGIEELTAACKRCSTWSREDIMCLGYLAIYAGFIEAQRTSTPRRASLARLVMDLEAFEAYPWGRVAFKFLMESVKKLDLPKTYAVEGFVEVLKIWIYNALPEYAAGFGDPVPGATPPLLGFLGGKGRKMPRKTDERADNIVKAVYVGGWVWDQTHWSVGGTKLWTNMKVEYQKVKDRGCGLTSIMVEGLSRCERVLSTQSCMIISLTEKVEEVEKIVREREKDDCTKSGSSGDVHQADKSVGDKDEDDKGEDEQTEDDKSEESKDEETSPQVSKLGRKRRAKTKEASPQGRQTKGNAKATGSESETGGIEPSVVVLEKEQSDIDYGSVKKLKQVGKVKVVCLLARANSERLRRLAPSQQSPFQGNSTSKVIIPNQPNRGQGYYPFDHVDRQKVSFLIDWRNLTLQHMDAGINLLRLRYTKHPEWFRLDIICLLDAVFTQVRSAKYTEFLDSPVNPDGSARDEEIAKSVKPIAHMLPYMLHMLSRGEDMELYMVYFTHERISASGVPQNTQSGDCGVYCLKYIEYHALGITFPTHDFCDKNVKLMRAKLAAEIFDEININDTEKGIDLSISFLSQKTSTEVCY
ncbi:hypothetical protein N665_0215s0010 [Sinapis alba]|nr:hypothetical protein N665_0215s0010 [Sinapis alba]